MFKIDFFMNMLVMNANFDMMILLPLHYVTDRSERHDLKSRLWLSFSPFLFPPEKEGRRKGE